METEPAVISIAAAARRISVSDDTIRRAIARGQLLAFRVGRAVRVDALAVDRLLVPAQREARPR